MGLDSFSYASSMQGQHSPTEFYPHYSPPSLHSDYNVHIKQETVSGGPQVPDTTSDHSGDDSVSQLSSPAYDSAPLQPPANNNSDMKSISDVLKSTYGTWDRVRDQLWIPRDPRDWSQDQVSHWLSWAIREFSLGQGPNIDTFITSLSMSGKELCGMNKQEFITRSPQYMGDILWAHLEILQRESEQPSSVPVAPPSVLDIKAPLAPASLPQFYLPQHPLPPSTAVSKTYTELEPPASKMSTTVLPPPLVPPPTSYASHTSSYASYPAPPPPPPYYTSYTPPYSGNHLNWMAGNEYLQCLPPSSFSLPPASCLPQQPSPPPSLPESASGPCFTGSGPIQLWQFLLELLTDKTCINIISWTGDGWEFKMNDPDEVAVRWGMRKNKPKMNYEKMSRAMRYYYDKNIILKTPGKRYVYRFICDLQGLLGFTSTEIQAMVTGTQGPQEVMTKC